MIVLACATLHNVANKSDFQYENIDAESDYRDLTPPTHEPPSDAGKQRANELLMFFA
jgi:hypothetical protein